MRNNLAVLVSDSRDRSLVEKHTKSFTSIFHADEIVITNDFTVVSDNKQKWAGLLCFDSNQTPYKEVVKHCDYYIPNIVGVIRENGKIWIYKGSMVAGKCVESSIIPEIKRAISTPEWVEGVGQTILIVLCLLFLFSCWGAPQNDLVNNKKIKEENIINLRDDHERVVPVSYKGGSQ